MFLIGSPVTGRVMSDHTHTSERVGFCGLGDIGIPMVNRLIDCGLPLQVYNRTPAKAEPLLARGASAATTPAELSESCTLVVTCLHGPQADRSVYLGPDGLLSSDVQGVVFLNTSTIGRSLALELAAATHRVGAHYIDGALMGGGRIAAAQGVLVMPVAGSPASLERAQVVLSMLAASVYRVGEIGAAQVLKLAYNYQWAVSSVALSQAVRMAIAGGADADTIVAVLGESARASAPAWSYLARMAAGLTEPRGTMDTLAKDLDLAVAMADELDVPHAAGTAAAASFHAVLAAGLDQPDVPALMAAPV
jgi:3-hydroxyisobutyrate dehydrogenase-like beta-hydroxyacid dehydrogenase